MSFVCQPQTQAAYKIWQCTIGRGTWKRLVSEEFCIVFKEKTLPEVCVHLQYCIVSGLFYFTHLNKSIVTTVITKPIRESVTPTLDRILRAYSAIEKVSQPSFL